jgi:hypothetical protein
VLTNPKPWGKLASNLGESRKGIGSIFLNPAFGVENYPLFCVQRNRWQKNGKNYSHRGSKRPFMSTKVFFGVTKRNEQNESEINFSVFVFANFVELVLKHSLFQKAGEKIRRPFFERT